LLIIKLDNQFNKVWSKGYTRAVGFDIVELCPNEIDKSSDFLAAKLYYKMLSYKYNTVNIDVKKIGF